MISWRTNQGPYFIDIWATAKNHIIFSIPNYVTWTHFERANMVLGWSDHKAEGQVTTTPGGTTLEIVSIFYNHEFLLLSHNQNKN